MKRSFSRKVMIAVLYLTGFASIAMSQLLVLLSLHHREVVFALAGFYYLVLFFMLLYVSSDIRHGDAP